MSFVGTLEPAISHFCHSIRSSFAEPALPVHLALCAASVGFFWVGFEIFEARKSSELCFLKYADVGAKKIRKDAKKAALRSTERQTKRPARWMRSQANGR